MDDLTPTGAAADAFLLAADATPIAHTIHRRLCLVAAVMTTFAIAPASVLLMVPLVVPAASAVFGLVMFAIYLAARQDRYYTKTTYALTLCMIAGCWFPASGTMGSAMLYHAAALVYAVVVFRGRDRAVGVLALVGITLALIAAEHAYPGLVRPFYSDTVRMLQLASGVVVGTGLATLVLGAVVTAYDRERERLGVSLTALYASRRTLDQLFNVNPDALCLVAPEEGRCVQVNGGFERLFGWSHADVTREVVRDASLWVAQEDREALVDALRASGEVRERVARVRRRDGRDLWGSISASWVETADRRLMLMSVRDITDRVRTQQELAQSRATLAALVNSAPDMVWLVESPHFALTQFNEAFAVHCRRTLGVEPRTGATPRALFPADEADVWTVYYQRALDAGPFTTEHVGRNGRSLLLSFGPVTHEGVVFGVSAFSHDITDMRAQELARADMERQLLQAQKMESLGRLAGGVAHDYNNMLTVIMGHAEYLRSTEPDDVRRDSLEAIERAADRSADLTRKLLAFGRRGKNMVEGVSVQAVVRDCLVMLAPSLRSDVRVELDLQETWSVDGDPSQLSQVVLNLCLNANEAMPDGGPMRIATRDVVAADAGGTPGEFVELRVSDAGVGIADEVKGRIFEPFFSTKPGSLVSGTGLGLATVDGVVHLHGGVVRVDSELRRGSTFTVRLPRGRLLQDAPVPAMSRQLIGGLILVVDDEPLVRNVATTALEALGFRALVATDGVEGVRLFAEQHASLAGVLLDLKMPRMSGSEAFASMHAIDPGVPVLVCSGYGDNEEVQRLIRGGARGLLMKPFTLKDLGEALAKLRA